MPHVEPEIVEPSANEVRELARVFSFLASFAPKHKLRKELQPRVERKAKIMAFKRNPEAVKIVDESGAEVPPAVLDVELARLEAEAGELQAAVDVLDAKPDAEKRVQPRDLQQALAFLGKHTDKVRGGTVRRGAGRGGEGTGEGRGHLPDDAGGKPNTTR